MKVICINNVYSNGTYMNLTIDKIYSIILPIEKNSRYNEDYYWLINDLGFQGSYEPKHFILLEEYRSKQIDKII